MTHVEYALYSRIFDDIVALHEHGDSAACIQLHGNSAGAALRTWGVSRRLDVVPRIGELPSRTWTTLEVTLAGEVSWCIVVHLDDRLSLAMPAAAAPETEIPF